MTFEELYEESKNVKDIKEEFGYLQNYAMECNHITEFGVRRGNSTMAFLGTCPNILISYDIKKQDRIAEIIKSLKGNDLVTFIYEIKDVRNIEIEETDLLFIDTLHTYDQLKIELELHAKKVRKYILIHDTIIFGEKGTVKNSKGLNYAIKEFLENFQDSWEEIFRSTTGSGLTVLERKNA